MQYFFLYLIFCLNYFSHYLLHFLYLAFFSSLINKVILKSVGKWKFLLTNPKINFVLLFYSILFYSIKVLLSPHAVIADGGAICSSGHLMVATAAKVT